MTSSTASLAPFGEFEWFEYPIAWEAAYQKRRGNRRYFAQYALMELMRQQYGIQSRTWLHLASVDRPTKLRFKAGEPWTPASPNPSRNRPDRTRRRASTWNTMRQQMGAGFESLQQAILRARFVGAYQGEPDLFCWSSEVWFFAEAKTLHEAFLRSQAKWWRIAKDTPGIKVFRCRVVVEGARPSGQPLHSQQWDLMTQTAHLQRRGLICTGDEFVKRVLGDRDA